jgi:hypothetical protein
VKKFGRCFNAGGVYSLVEGLGGLGCDSVGAKNHAGKKVISKKLLLGLVITVIFLMASCDDRSLGMPVSYTIKYEITGNATSVNITINNANGNTEQFSHVSLPWEKTFTVEIEKDRYYFAYVSAQNQGNSGDVTARIYKDGSVFKSSTSSGAYVIASASGSVDY